MSTSKLELGSAGLRYQNSSYRRETRILGAKDLLWQVLNRLCDGDVPPGDVLEVLIDHASAAGQAQEVVQRLQRVFERQLSDQQEHELGRLADDGCPLHPPCPSLAYLDSEE